MNRNDRFGVEHRLSNRNFDDSFDKTFNRMSRGIVVVWVIGALCSIALTIAIIWGIVQVVQALT